MIVLLGFSHKGKTTDFPMEPPCKSGRKNSLKVWNKKHGVFQREMSWNCKNFQYYLWSFAFSQCWKSKTKSSNRNVVKKGWSSFVHNTLILWFFETDRPQENQLLTLMINFFNRSVNIYLSLIFSGYLKLYPKCLINILRTNYFLSATSRNG